MSVSYPVYPFSALVGQERLKQALILNAINPHIGGVLIRGEKGTAKSTAVRGLARLLPPITVVKGCPYGCTPPQAAGLCPACTASRSDDKTLPTVVQPTRLVELPVSASEDRVVGSLDLEHAIAEGQRRFEPGLLAQVNNGLLYVDEVNLLDDHLVDLLLDAAAMGVNTVEREGISVSHPAHFILVGTMNPEEGELRPQLLDRFGLAVEVSGLSDVESRVAVIERRMAYEAAPQEFIAHWQTEEEALAARIVQACAMLPQVQITRENMATVAHLSLELDVDGHRADLTILEAARTHAAWEQRMFVQIEDIRIAAELALPHRMRRHPFAEIGDYRESIKTVLEESSQLAHTEEAGQQDNELKKNNSGGGGPTNQAAPNAEWDSSPDVMIQKTPSTSDTSSTTSTTSDHATGGVTYESSGIFRPRRMEGQRDNKMHRAAGRRSQCETSTRQGRYVSSRRVPLVTDLALDATLREAAPHQRQRQHEAARSSAAGAARPKIMLTRNDMRQKVRIRRTRNAVCFVVDASWSMAAEERMRATKGAVLSLLRDAYQRRDHVGLVSFQRTYATVLLPLTNSVDLAQRHLHAMPVGGKTPLARGLLTGFELLQRARSRNPDVIPLMVILTDGHANVAMSNLPPHIETYRLAHFIARQQIHSIVIDTECPHIETSLGLGTVASAHASRLNTIYSQLEGGKARRLAEHLQGEYYRLEDIREHVLADMVRARLHAHTTLRSTTR